MPYLKSSARHALTHADADPETPGELNYVMTLEAIAYLDRMGLSYQVLNDIVGAFELAKQEFVARVVRPYEDSKREANGDVY